MAARSSWKGFIKLSLVSVPVKAYTAHATSQEVRLNQLHEKCSNRIKYKKFCPEHGEVSQDEIVSGYEYSKGQYVVIDTDELEKLRNKIKKVTSTLAKMITKLNNGKDRVLKGNLKKAGIDRIEITYKPTQKSGGRKVEEHNKIKLAASYPE